MIFALASVYVKFSTIYMYMLKNHDYDARIFWMHIFVG